MYFKKIEVKDFGGINNHAPVVIELGKKAIVDVTGDAGAGKSSFLNAILVATGNLSKDNSKFVNNDTNNLELDIDFVGKDKLNYHLRATKSQFKLTYEGENLPEPVTKLKELIGVVGVSPMDIKNKPLKEQMKWIASYANIDEASFEKKMDKIKADIKTAQESRAIANREYKALKITLEESDLYNNWEASEKKYAKKTDISKLSEELKAAGDASDKLLQAETKLKSYKETETSLIKQIAELQARLEQTQEAITKGEKFVSDNKDAKKKYDEVRLRYDDSAKEAVQYDRWQQIKQKKANMDEFETLSQTADAKEKELLQKKKELQWEILPDIKNVDFVLEDVVEDGKSYKEGMYWDGKSTAQMSETEWWNVVMKIWEKFKVKVIVIDNFQSLGSQAVDTLNKLHKNGATIFAAEMKRGQKELIIDTNIS
jgi:energy-coupling factor transporter ATP-binding protein EcfA2